MARATAEHIYHPRTSSLASLLISVEPLVALEIFLRGIWIESCTRPQVHVLLSKPISAPPEALTRLHLGSSDLQLSPFSIFIIKS